MEKDKKEKDDLPTQVYALVNGIRDQTDIINIFKNINEDIMNNIVIQGIENITDIVIDKISINKSESINYLLTDGTNLLKIMNEDYVDYTQCFSNAPTVHLPIITKVAVLFQKDQHLKL